MYLVPLTEQDDRTTDKINEKKKSFMVSDFGGSKYSSGGWTLDYFLPVWDMGLKKNVDKILSAKGKTVGIFLPIEIDGIKNDYYFKFLITDVKKDKYPYRPQTVID